jgi:thiosulfate dehydrogenase (quinone) large subunit
MQALPLEPQSKAPTNIMKVFALIRVSIGLIFLWAFFDKLLGLGYSTPAARSWLNGGSPTKGYLGSSEGPLAGFYKAIAGHPATDALFMAGLLMVGTAVLLGIGLRVAGASGALMMLLMWSSHFPPTTHPFLDDHVVYALLFVSFPLMHVGDVWGLGRWWAHQPVVERHHALM